MITKMINGVSRAISAVVIAVVTIYVWSIAIALVSVVAIVVLNFLGECIKHSMH
jgi:hypothetical protein